MNDLQKLLEIKGISAKDISLAANENYHSVQKTIKGQRPTPHIRQAIADYLGYQVDQLFGPGSTRKLRALINREIDTRTEIDRERLRRRYLIDMANSIPNKRMAGNG